MVFVLGVLTLLALVGLVLIARTHGESRRVRLDMTAQTADSTLANVVRGIQETLWRDIWGPAPNTNDPRPLDSNRPASAAAVLENNEAFDAPGDNDRWLASTVPYMLYETNPTNPLYGTPLSVRTFTGASPPPTYPISESNVLAWKNVSYVGTDLFNNDPLQPFAWATNSRFEAPLPVAYATGKLSDVMVLQTPPPGDWATGGPMIPGSTTNVTIADAFARWADSSPGGHQDQLLAAFPGTSPRFPYFDTNADGELDLYDADGDGVPDSPLSLEIPIDTPNPSAPRKLYAAVRIVDHSSMLNLNVASSATLPDGSATFDERLPGYQRRGQRATELMLDDLIHRKDSFLTTANRSGRMVSHRNKAAIPDPTVYDANVVRRTLAGGPANPNVVLYGLADEASLRHRGVLVPHGRRFEFSFNSYETVDRALPATLQWTREIETTDYGYVGPESRWVRFNAQWGDPQGLYEGNDVGGVTNPVMGWRTLMQEDEPFSIKRQLVTTVSHAVEVPPDIRYGLATTDARLAQLRSIGMDWPVLNTPGHGQSPTLSGAFDPANVNDAVPEWARVLRIDLNMGSAANPAAARDDFLRYAAAAMYLALEGVPSVQGIPVSGQPLNREWLAWQFAANLVDYRDYDNDPTIIYWPTQPGRVIYGVEKQPFLTEAYAHLRAGDTSGGPSPTSRPGDRWFFAVELFVPPYWQLSTNNLYIRTPVTGSGPAELMPLSSFLSVSGNFPPPMDGGPTGRWIVLCGSTTNPPTTISPVTLSTFYSNPRFRIATDGNGSVELVYSLTGAANDPSEHVIDAIGPHYSGQGNTSAMSVFSGNSAVDTWARKPAGMAVDTRMDFSLIRSTKGWRFTTAWHRYGEVPPPPRPASRPPLGQSLGRANSATDNLDKFIPESVWPGRAPINGVFPPGAGGTFGSEVPFRDFDSPADLSRLLIVGPIHRVAPTDPPFLLDQNGAPLGEGQIPVTEVLAELTASTFVSDPPAGDLPSTTLERVAVGRIDFEDALSAGAKPWTHRLMDFFTTRSPVWDGIDNDGSGQADLADPAEGARLLYRVAGGININTAPVSVLRTIPFVSMLPSSVEFMLRVSTAVNAAIEFDNAANAGVYWDLASAIVARRELRHVPVRLWNPANQRMEMATVARRGTGLGRPTPADSGPFGRAIELSSLKHITGDTGTFADQHAPAFRIDRFYSDPANPVLRLVNHKVIPSDPDAGPWSPLSPDFRMRRLDNDEDGNFDTGQGDDYMVDYMPLPVPVGAPADYFETGGIRARDILLTRWQNQMQTRSDVFTTYIALIDENGNYVQRGQVTLDRSDCFRKPPIAGSVGGAVLPRILTREEGSYAEAVR